MRTIGSFEDYVDPIQEVIEDLLLPTLFGQSEPLPNEVRRLATLATGQGGLGIPDLRSEPPQQFAASRLLTTAHVDSITSQSSIMVLFFFVLLLTKLNISLCLFYHQDFAELYFIHI